jgi:uncharacterized protein
VNSYVKTQGRYQLRLFFVALVVLGLLHILAPDRLSRFFSVGNLAAPANGVAWMGIAEGESWLSLGATLSIFITLATIIFVYLQFRKRVNLFPPRFAYLGWVLLFAASNSLSEEIVFRLGVIVPLFGGVENSIILLISAIAFGLPHLRGMPNGIIGACMATLLGWILAKSVIETNGFFWAWFIHFLQDVVIFYVFVVSSAAKKTANR